MSLSQIEDRSVLTALDRPRTVGGLRKRLFDMVGAFALLVFLAPVMLLIALAIRILDPGPVIFGHRRIGAGDRRFQCFKFRTMVVNSKEVLQALLDSDPEARAEWEATQKLRNDPRITLLGRILRETSLDELPQLFNVLRGDMSLVGPRPIVDAEIERYGSDFDAYCRARPGITGLWQVSGRSNTSYDRRVQLDVAYVSNWSLVKDISILVKTISVVLKREGSC
jgi:Undecaprenyl-phosphate galactose phosphotransferase WbaP